MKKNLSKLEETLKAWKDDQRRKGAVNFKIDTNNPKQYTVYAIDENGKTLDSKTIPL
jgi:hypothetical protein